MPADLSHMPAKYDSVAAGWGDKMRLLGYYDSYLGFLTSGSERPERGQRVIDIGCGTGAMAEAWTAIHGPDQAITLLDPSAKMLDYASQTLARRGTTATPICESLEQYQPGPRFDAVMAAHVIEHARDPRASLQQMRALARPAARLWLVVSKPHWCNAIIWVQWRHKSYRTEQVARLLRDSGWNLRRDYAFPSGPPSRTSRGYLAEAV